VNKKLNWHVTKLEHGQIVIVPVKDRLYRIAQSTWIKVYFSDGTYFLLTIKAGFLFDGRSGPKIVDYLLPNLGNQRYLACILLHDSLAYDLGISFETTNKVFRQCLRLVPIGRFRASTAHFFVTHTPGWFGVKNEEEALNKTYLHLEWAA
jgi:hypothetical protein